MDKISAKARSDLMSRVRTRDTKPELEVRRLLHSMGYRFSTHKKELPGTPDIYLKKHSKVIQVFGCFWHGHECRKGTLPKTRQDFWRQKIERNVKRDKDSLAALNKKGLETLIVWECELADRDQLKERIANFMKAN